MNLTEMVIQILKQISFKSIQKKQNSNMEIDTNNAGSCG